MGRRWLQNEEEALAEVRKRLSSQLASCPQFPEVVGDRRILRFLRGNHMNIDLATKMYSDMLQWRKKNNVDLIREEILFGGANSPFKFPLGELILKMVPQIVITGNARDKIGRPLCLERFCFSPKEVFKAIKNEEYLQFLIYCLEYKSLVSEQLSHEAEVEYIKKHQKEEDRKDGYGVIIREFNVRDLKGVSLAHFGSEGRAILKAAIEIGNPNYQESLGKSHLINVPSIFNTIWYFIKGLLDETTVVKFEISGSSFLDTLLKDITIDNIPTYLGGKFELYNEPFNFDTSRGGPLHYPGAEEDAAQFLRLYNKHNGLDERPSVDISTTDTSMQSDTMNIPSFPIKISTGAIPIKSSNTSVVETHHKEVVVDSSNSRFSVPSLFIEATFHAWKMHPLAFTLTIIFFCICCFSAQKELIIVTSLFCISTGTILALIFFE